MTPFPAVVLNHAAGGGSPRAEHDYCPIVEYFVGKGYVVFEPIRRGYTGDAGISTNSGELPQTTLDRVVAGGRPPSRSPLVPFLLQTCTSHDPRTGDAIDADCVDTELQFNQRLEVLEAVAFLRGLTTLIDPDKIALIGHAAGANIAAMSALGLLVDPFPPIPGVQAAVLLSPAERVWARVNPYLRERLVQSVRTRHFSIAIFQPRNGESVGPAEALAEAAITTQDFEFMVSLFPAVGSDDPADVQHRFATRAAHVDRWAPLAWRFFHINGVK